MQVLYQSAQGKFVANCAKALNSSQGHVGQQGDATKRLARIGIAQVHFDKRPTAGQQSVAEHHAGVSIAARIEDVTVRGVAHRLNPVDQLTFVVGLKGVDFHGQLLSKSLQL